MPDGSSSAAPVIKPGPRSEKTYGTFPAGQTRVSQLWFLTGSDSIDPRSSPDSTEPVQWTGQSARLEVQAWIVSTEQAFGNLMVRTARDGAEKTHLAQVQILPPVVRL